MPHANERGFIDYCSPVTVHDDDIPPLINDLVGWTVVVFSVQVMMQAKSSK